MRTRFDSGEFGSSQQYSAWRQAVASAFYPLDVSLCAEQRGDGFDAWLATMEFGAIELMEMRSAPMVARRKLKARQPGRALFVSCLIGGRAHLEEEAREVTQEPGDVVLWDSSRSGGWRIEHSLHSLVLRIPMRLVHSRTTQGERLTEGVLRGSTPMAQLVRSMVSGTAQIQGLPTRSTAAQRLASALVDTVIAGLEAQRKGTEAPDKLLHAKDYCCSRLGDAELSTESIAAALHISPRTLNRLFAAEGQSAMRWLWQQRLEASRQLLASGGRVTDVALSCGFTNCSHFSHAFRRAFATSPSSYAARHEGDG